MSAVAYTIDDGNGGKVHVNVSVSLYPDGFRLIFLVRVICEVDAVFSMISVLTPCSTSGENIGDSGLIQALRAWNAQYDASVEAGNEYLLPGLDYTR